MKVSMLETKIHLTDGRVLSDSSRTAIIPPLSSKNYRSIPLEEVERISHGAIASVFAVTDLDQDGTDISSNMTYFVPARELHHPKPDIDTELVRNGRLFQLRLPSNVLARDVYISFGQEGVCISDNYFDLLPHQKRQLEVSGAACIRRLQANLRVMSLADAVAFSGGQPARQDLSAK